MQTLATREPQELMTPVEVARSTRVSAATVYRAIARSDLEHDW